MFVVLSRNTLVLLLLGWSSPSATQDMYGNSYAGKMAPLPIKPSYAAAVVGGDVLLPCDSQPVKDDIMTLVVWYKYDDPIYSYDTTLGKAKAHWTEDLYKERIKWMGLPNSGLWMENIQTNDRAIYSCRIDFEKSPTRNLKISLGVIELPDKPAIFDESGTEVHGVAGPYNEGGDFKLICSVKGGVPSPRIHWQRDDNTLASIGVGHGQVSGEVKSLMLTVRNASRDHLSSLYSCSVENTNLAPGKAVSIRVDLYLKPLLVEIMTKDQPLSVGRKSDLWCRSAGARPPANITWWLGGRMLKSTTKYSDLKDDNETHSLLEWVPSKEDNGEVVICRAEHSKVNHWAIESKLLLNIYYTPETRILLGAEMNPNDIEEGDDVYFECKVDANPPVYKIVWEHNGVQLLNNPSTGVIVTGRSHLAIRNVTRAQAGEYTCTASNVEGDRKSHILKLKILYKPICRAREMRIQGALLQEPSDIVCEVDSVPAPDSFEWTLNNSGVSVIIDPDRFTTEAEEGRSILTYTPLLATDYGTLSCRATNLAGQQLTPCLYTLLPATQPDPPLNCTVYNLTHDSLDLLCSPGYDGGLQCMYIAEVWNNEGLAVNATSDATSWNFRRLGAKKKLRLVVYAVNARGLSEQVIISVKTAQKLSPRTEAQEAWEFNWAVGIVLGAVITIAIILCVALIVSKLRHKQRDYEVSLPASSTQKIIVPERHSLHGTDDKNPDLIPLSKGLADCQPQPPSYSAMIAASQAQAKPSDSVHSLHSMHSPTTTPMLHGFYTDSQRNVGHNNRGGKPYREIVTTRTPLLAAHQESRV